MDENTQRFAKEYGISPYKEQMSSLGIIDRFEWSWTGFLSGLLLGGIISSIIGYVTNTEMIFVLLSSIYSGIILGSYSNNHKKAWEKPFDGIYGIFKNVFIGGLATFAFFLLCIDELLAYRILLLDITYSLFFMQSYYL